MEDIKKNGYYNVRHDSVWEVAFRCTDHWKVVGTEAKFVFNYWDEVIETRIINPDENKKTKKKRAEKYEGKLKINGSFDTAIKALVSKPNED